MNRTPVADILTGLLPEVKSCSAGGEQYDPSNCLAVYYRHDDNGHSLQLPAVMAGEAAATRGGQGCTLIEGIPQKPPTGCIIVGLWDDLQAVAPHLLEGLSKPENEQGYIARLDRYALIVGNTRNGVVFGAQTFIQLIAASPKRRVEAMTISDAPECERRSVVFDARGVSIHTENLMQIAGLLSSFKGNRLHLLLGIETVTSGGKGLTASDAEQLHEVCLEYGVTLTPWLDLAGAIVDGKILPNGAADAVFAFSDVFDSNSIGVAPFAIPHMNELGLDGIRAFLKDIVINKGTELDLYMHSELVNSVFPEQAKNKYSGIVSCVTQGPNAYNSIKATNEKGFRTAVFAKSLSNGFIPPLSENLFRDFDMGISLAKAESAIEFGYWADNLRRGHIWENDLPAAVTCMSLGWGGPMSAAATNRRLTQLAYSESAPAVTAARESIIATFPEPLRAEEGKGLVNLAFGFEGDIKDWRAIRKVDWSSVEQSLYETDQLIRNCRNQIQRNAETLDHIDLAPSTLKFLMNMVNCLSHAREHYAAARHGRAGSLTFARASIEQPAATIPIFIAKIKSINDLNGTCQDELNQIRNFSQKISAMLETISMLDSSESLPTAEKLGFPPL
ncbi:MAG: hypothetical protein JXR97_12525 [Planctomycetes bacterium]|nr:hypothetical protein [Planctomycetota bacterium]